ncbi:MAG TPA: glycosyltransferase family 2 protein [Pyrinomonadaceae bacterium]|jgi:glycosyltransferase involved in cell wall biosynthesis|nr:glycosyltransferase family 2 protein [Pyrinomonadaceae bacterium]
MMSNEPEVSVVIPTYNRSALLRSTVDSVLNQDTQTTFEVVVIDNNSSDDTKDVVASLIETYPGKVRYVVERKQGNAHARNRGIEEAKGAIVAFVDDDVTVDKNWLTSLKTILDARSDLSFVGGKVLPQWNGPPPSWLTPDHWAPLALLDYGNDEFAISGNSPRGLLTANIAFRRNVFEETGMFLPDLQRVKNMIGSMEDHEFLLRVCRSGKQGIYTPRMIATTHIDTERLTKAYHRRWHTGHGHFYAVLADPDWERSKFRLAGVPAHLFKETATNALLWCGRVLRGKTDAAFVNECRLRFFSGFFRQRRRQPS